MSIHGPMRVKSEARMTPKMTSKDDISCSQGYYPHTAFGSNLIAGAGVKAILAILESNAGKRPFWPAEKQVMSQMREWSPLEDLQIVHAALNLQKDIILSRIRGLDPSFVEPISAAKSIRNAILRASKELSSADSGDSAAEKPAPCLNRSLYIADDAVIPDHMNLVTIENAVVDVEDDSLLLEGDLIEELNLDVDLMAVDMEDGFVDSGDELGAAGDDGEEGEGEDEEEELSKGDIEQGDEESKSDDEEEEEEDSLGGEEADRNELEDDDGGEEGSKEDLEGDDGEDEEEASCSIDFLESGMRLQDGEDDESAGEEDYNGKEEHIEGASSPFSEGGASLDTSN